MSDPAQSPPPRARTVLLLLLALAGSAIVQWPALYSDFRHDDWMTFYQAANMRPIDFILLPHGGHLMLTRNAIHLLFFDLFDLHPLPYFVAAFGTHLLNVALLFLLALRLGAGAGIAAFVAALWGMAPVQQSSVNWVALYGNQTVATFVLWPLVDLAELAVRKRAPSRLALVRWGVLIAAAATSFGPGFAAALVFPAVAWLLLPPESGRTRAALALSAATLAVVVLFLVIRPGSTFEFASFWFSKLGVISMLRAFSGLCSYGIASLLGGPWLTFAQAGVPLGPLQGNDPTPLVHAAWAVAALVCAGIAWAWRRAVTLERRHMLSLLLLIAAIHGLVTVARTLPGIQLLGLDKLLVTARYQYVATALWGACIALALAVLARTWRPSWRTPDWLAPAALAAWMAAVVVPYASVARQVDWDLTAWSRETLESERAWLEQQITAAAPGHEVLIQNRPFEGLQIIQPLLAPRDFPGSAAVFLFLQHNAAHRADNVKFIESDRTVVAELRERLHTKIAGILLTPEEAAQRPAE